MINGAHSIIYSKKPEADRGFLRDVLGLPNVNVGDGWLIFGLPPAEVAVHPSEKNNIHEFYLMCEDVKEFVASMKKHKVACSEIFDRGWGPFGRGDAAGRRETWGLPTAACQTKVSHLQKR